MRKGEKDPGNRNFQNVVEEYNSQQKEGRYSTIPNANFIKYFPEIMYTPGCAGIEEAIIYGLLYNRASLKKEQYELYIKSQYTQLAAELEKMRKAQKNLDKNKEKAVIEIIEELKRLKKDWVGKSNLSITTEDPLADATVSDNSLRQLFADANRAPGSDDPTALSSFSLGEYAVIFNKEEFEIFTNSTYSRVTYNKYITALIEIGLIREVSRTEFNNKRNDTDTYFLEMNNFYNIKNLSKLVWNEIVGGKSERIVLDKIIRTIVINAERIMEYYALKKSDKVYVVAVNLDNEKEREAFIKRTFDERNLTKSVAILNEPDMIDAEDEW